MKLWTFQTTDVAEMLQSGHDYVCNPQLSDLLYDKEDPEYAKRFIQGYDFISHHLNDISLKPDGITYPVWSWYSTYECDAEDVISEFQEGYKDNKESVVLIELEVPDNEVLLSNFANFHDVLNDHTSENNAYFLQVCNKHNCDEYEDEYGQLWCETHWKEAFALMDNATEEEKRSSWDKYVIKDIDYDVDFIQACFWKISPEYVIDYHNIV